MADIINLRRARKDKIRTNAETKAATNRVAHGRTKSEKQISAANLALTKRRIDGHKLADQSDGVPPAAGTASERSDKPTQAT
jgi:hypothetical protein